MTLLRWKQAAALGLAVLALALVPIVEGRGGDHLSREQVTRYEAAIVPALKDGGETVERGMKPAVADLLSLHVTPRASIAVESEGWVNSLTEVRGKVAAVEAPGELDRARTLFLDSLDKYIEAARGIGRAASAQGAQVAVLAHTAIDVAREADSTYNAASAVVQKARATAGLGPSPDLPAGP